VIIQNTENGCLYNNKPDSNLILSAKKNENWTVIFKNNSSKDGLG